MVYAKRMTKRPFARSTAARKPKSSAITIAKKAYSLAKRVDKRAERKYFNSSYTSPMSSGSFNVYNPLEIAQGDSAIQRDGDSIEVRHMTCRLALDVNSNNNITPCNVRIVIVQDLQQQPGVAIAPGTVFLTPGDWNSNYNFPAAAGRFKVLKDMTIDVTPDTLCDASGFITNNFYSMSVLKTMKFSIKPTHKKVSWNGGNTTDFEKNHVYILMQASNGGYTVQPYYQVQTCYVDS